MSPGGPGPGGGKGARCERGPSGALSFSAASAPEGAEAQTLGDRLLAACRKFWPVLPVFIVVMEAVEYVGKFFIWVRKLLR